MVKSSMTSTASQYVLYAVSPLNLCKPTKLRPSTQRAGQCGQAQNAQSKPMTDQTMPNVDEVSFSGNISIYSLRGYSASGNDSRSDESAMTLHPERIKHIMIPNFAGA